MFFAPDYGVHSFKQLDETVEELSSINVLHTLIFWTLKEYKRSRNIYKSSIYPISLGR